MAPIRVRQGISINRNVDECNIWATVVGVVIVVIVVVIVVVLVVG